MEIKITDSKYLITNPILKINNEMKVVYDNKIDYDLMNRNYVGSTPIYMAIVNKNIKIIELLLEKNVIRIINYIIIKVCYIQH